MSTRTVSERRAAIVVRLREILTLMEGGDEGVWRRILHGEGDGGEWSNLEEILSKALLGDDEGLGGAVLDAAAWSRISWAADRAGMSRAQALGRVTAHARQRFQSAREEFIGWLSRTPAVEGESAAHGATVAPYRAPSWDDPALYGLEPSGDAGDVDEGTYYVDEGTYYVDVLEQIGEAAGVAGGFDVVLGRLLADEGFVSEAVGVDGPAVDR
jgi:hypothetical protein